MKDFSDFFFVVLDVNLMNVNKEFFLLKQRKEILELNLNHVDPNPQIILPKAINRKATFSANVFETLSRLNQEIKLFNQEESLNCW